MKSNTLKTSVLTLLLLLIVALSGCGETTTTTTAVDTDGNIDTVDSIANADSKTKVKAATQSYDATIVIEGGKISPTEISVPKQATILVVNKESTTQRISMPFYGASVAVDVPAEDQGIIVVNASYAGRVSIELNTARAGGVTVTE